MKKIKDFYPKKEIINIKKKFEDCLNSKKGGFIFICNMEKTLITDIYNGVCADAVLDAVAFAVGDAVKIGILEKKCEHNKKKIKN